MKKKKQKTGRGGGEGCPNNINWLLVIWVCLQTCKTLTVGRFPNWPLSHSQKGYRASKRHNGSETAASAPPNYVRGPKSREASSAIVDLGFRHMALAAIFWASWHGEAQFLRKAFATHLLFFPTDWFRESDVMASDPTSKVENLSPNLSEALPKTHIPF